MTDINNNRVRKVIIGTGVVTTIAGQSTAGSADGTGAAAQFFDPSGVCNDGAGNLFVADAGNHRIRRIIIATGVVTTIAGGTQGFADGIGAAAQFDTPRGICSDGAGNLFVADAGNHRIRRIVIATGVVTTIAGNTFGFTDATGTAAQFNFPYSICNDGLGNLFVADASNNRIRRIVIATGVVSTLVGSTSGFADGIGTLAQFNFPNSLCYDGAGNLFVADLGNNRIRRIVIATSAVTTIAGSTLGFSDGTGTVVQFNSCYGICSDGLGNLFVADGFNHRIRRIDIVTTFSASYSGTNFPEAVMNNGTITTTQDITLTNDSWVSTLTGGVHYNATGVPSGLSISINRISLTVARISFTGAATAHANANDATVTLNFANTATGSNNAAGVTGLNPASLTLDFNDPTLGPPTVTSLIVPNTTPGTTITINGTNFTGASAVNIGGQVATFTVVSATQITATIPAGVVGTSLSVTTPSGTGSTVGFAPAPTITGFSPSAAAPGSVVTLTGANFITGAVSTVFIGGQPATFTVVSPTQITVTVPAGAAGSGATVTTVSGNASNAGFTVNTPPAPPPPVAPVAPTAFQLGASPTLQSSLNLPYGLSLLTNGSPTPVFSLVGGNVPPGVNLSSSGMLSGTPTQQGTYTFTVSASNGAGSTLSVITIVVGAPRPLATAVEQTTGGIGTPVVIRGYNFSGATGVSFGGIPALSFTIDNDGQITAILGAGNSGPIVISTPNGTSVAPSSFVYTPPPAPVIGSINPAAAESGDEDYRIVLRGRNFSQYATYLVLPETGTNASFSVPLPVVIESLTATEATLRLPLASRTLGVKRLTVRLADTFASSTFAVVAGAKPVITSQTVPSTTATSDAFTTELRGTGFFRRGYGRITVNGELANSSVLDAGRARVEIPARLNILGSKIMVRITNYDGQFAETTVNVVSRVAPLISHVVSRVENGRLRFLVRGSGFWGVVGVLVQNQAVLLVRSAPTELEIEFPSVFPRPRLTEEAWVLMVENLDGQKYGYRITPSLFYPLGASFGNSIAPKNTAETNSANAQTSTARNTALLGHINISPNPVSELLVVDLAAFTGQGRMQVMNARGEEMFSIECTGGERVSVDVRSLVSGAYFVRIVGEGVRVVKQIAVIR
jgi:hypothetical protein